jgi:hypothetical protein
MPQATPAQRARARIGPLVPEGWVLEDPESFDNGWRLGVHSVANPLVSIGVWNPDLEQAIMELAEELAKERPPN